MKTYEVEIQRKEIKKQKRIHTKERNDLRQLGRFVCVYRHKMITSDAINV